MSKVFISYRRDDSADVTGRIYDRLTAHFGTKNVFKDVDSIPLGIDFRQHLTRAVSGCQVLLAVIGRSWLQAGNAAGQRRLDDPRDFVRLEIEVALQREIPVVPILVQGASMPAAEELPPSLRALAYRNGIAVRADPDFHRDMDRLIGQMERFSRSAPPPPSVLPAEPPKPRDQPSKPRCSAEKERHSPQAEAVEPFPRRRRRGLAVALGVVVLLSLVAVGLVFSLNGQGRVPKWEGEAPAEPPAALDMKALDMTFVRVPKGSFWMGGSDGKPGDKQEVIRDDFWLGVHEITQGQWEAVMGADKNESYFSRKGEYKDRVKDFTDAELKKFPVENVSWKQVQEFIEKLNAREKNSGWVYRLPTEVEWEYAARGGASSKEDCSFDFYLDRPTNDLSSTQANFDGNFPAGDGKKGEYKNRTEKIGSYSPNRLGIYDMHGNVWEWTSSVGGSDRVDRGGCWNDNGSYCRAALRSWDAPEYRSSSLGFRLARVPSGVAPEGK
jgi:formylglycine-generating enzyme required for sulfatase activity